MAGTGMLARLAFRRDRLMLPAWIYVLTALIGVRLLQASSTRQPAPAHAAAGVMPD